MEKLIESLLKLGYTEREAEKVIASYEERRELDALRDYVSIREAMTPKYERD